MTSVLQLAYDVFLDTRMSQSFRFLPKPIGMRTIDGIREVLSVDTPIGEEITLNPLTPSEDYVDSFSIEFFQGNWQQYGERSSIGKVNISIPQPGPKDSVNIVLKLKYNKDCLLCVKAFINNEEVYNVSFRDRLCTLSTKELREKHPDLYSFNTERFADDIEREISEKKREIIARAKNSSNGDEIIKNLSSIRNSNKSMDLNELITFNRKLDHILEDLK